MDNDIEKIKVTELFSKEKYKIPIYQRNYAWGKDEIEQLLDDINLNASEKHTYYLGTLIVNKKEDKAETYFEVIDGQQRLTTLYLICIYINNQKKNAIICHEGTLKFNARERYNNMLEILYEGILQSDDDNEIKEGYQKIKTYFHTDERNNNEFLESFCEKLEYVEIIRVPVSRETDKDLNRYFEIMNTRGEQLELHEIAKSRILETFEKDDNKGRELGAKIWEACSNMDSYVQMNFTKENRKRIFTENWGDFNIKNFNDLQEIFQYEKNKCNEKEEFTLQEILEGKVKDNNDINQKDDNKAKDEEADKYKSIISFSNFLLQVNKVVNEESENNLNDKIFLKNMESNWKNNERAKKFLFYLLKCRFYFDQYIIKSENDEKWTLKQLTKYKNNRNEYGKTTNIATERRKQLINLQACLRVTYTSPITMDWIYIVLENVIKETDDDVEAVSNKMIDILERYCIEKINLKDEEGKDKAGFDVDRIIFTYLDYILYRDYVFNNENDSEFSELKETIGEDWQFRFRNSIEHFHPQNEKECKIHWTSEEINNFGNLVLITVSANSKFSNLPPKAKIELDQGKEYLITNQSPKFVIMKSIVEKEKEWNQNTMKEHGDRMKQIINNDINRINKKEM